MGEGWGAPTSQEVGMDITVTDTHTHTPMHARTHTHSAVNKASVQTHAVITVSSCQCIAEIQNIRKQNKICREDCLYSEYGEMIAR